MKLTRRKFFKQTSTGLVAMGALATVPGLAAASAVTTKSSTKATTLSPEMAAAGPLVAHIIDASTGEISLMLGTKEVVYQDLELVQRLFSAAM